MNLEIRNISKTYPGGVQALNNVSMTIQPGMFGLLGPNGAGKSSLMRTLATLQDPDEGSVTLGGINVLEQKYETRKLLGYLPQEFGVYPHVNAEEMLNHFAALKGIQHAGQRRKAVRELLYQTNLYDDRKKKLGGFSGGMKQRFGIATVLLGDPKLIIVDEPTAGLDPEERSRFHNLLSDIGEHIIVILSTHIVDDVSELCRDMVVMHKGQVLFTGQPVEAIQQLDGKIWRMLVPKKLLNSYRLGFKILSTRLFAGEVMIRVLSDTQPGQEFIPADPILEDVYFSTIKQHSGESTL